MYSTDIELVHPYLIRFQSYLEDIDQIIPLDSPHVALLDSSDNFYFYNDLIPASDSPPETFNLLAERKKKLQLELKRPYQTTEVIKETIQHIEYLTMNHYLLKLSERDICITEFGVPTAKAKPLFLSNTRAARFLKKLTANLIFFILPSRDGRDTLFICRWQIQKYKKLRWTSSHPPKRVEYINYNKLAILTLNSTVIIYDLSDFRATRVIISQQNDSIHKMLVSNLESSKIHCFSSSLDQYTCYDSNGVCIRTASMAVEEEEGIYRLELIGDSLFLFWSSNDLKIYHYTKNRLEIVKQLTASRLLELFVCFAEDMNARFHKIKVSEDQTILVVIRTHSIKDDNVKLKHMAHQDTFIAIKASEMLKEHFSKNKSTVSISSPSKNQILCLENAKMHQIVAMDIYDTSLLCAVTSESDFLLYELKFYQLLKQKRLSFEKVLSVRFISDQRLIVQHQVSAQQITFDFVLLPNLRSSPLMSAYLNKKGWRFTNVSLFLGNEQLVAGITQGTLILNTLPSLNDETEISKPQNIEANQDEKDETNSTRRIKIRNKAQKTNHPDELIEERPDQHSEHKKDSRKVSKPVVDFIKSSPLVSFSVGGSKGIKSKIFAKYDSQAFSKVFALHKDGIIATKQKSEPNKSRIINLESSKDLFDITFNDPIHDIVGLEGGSMAAASIGEDGQITKITIFDWKESFLYLAIDCVNSPFLIGSLQNHFVWVDSNEIDQSLLDVKAVNLLNCKSPNELTSLEQELSSVFIRGTPLLEGVLFEKAAVCFTRGKRRMFLQEWIASPEFICTLEIASISFEFFKTLLVANRKFKYSLKTLKEIHSFIFPKAHSDIF